MADSYLIKIKPTITPEDGRKMESDLNSRFKRVAKKFGGALRTVGGALKGLLTGAAVAMITNPFEKLNEKLNNTLSYADQITTRAGAIGTTAGRLAQVETVAKAARVTNIDQILTRFQTMLARARLGEDKTLADFTKYDDTLTAFLAVLKSIREIKDADIRTFSIHKIFGRENAAKMSELIAVDFAERWAQIFGKMDVGKIRKAASPFVVNVGQQAQTKETGAGRLAQVEAVAKASGIQNLDQILTRFQAGLAAAKLGENKTLSKFTKYDDTLTAFLNVLKSLKKIKDVDERTLAIQKIFGRENAAKMSELIAVDFADRWAKMASPFVVNAELQTKETGADVGFEGLADEFDLIFERLGALEDKQAVKSQRRMFEDFISKSETITGKLIDAQDEAERRRLDTENVQMKSFEQFARMAEETEKTKKILAELQKALVPAVVKGVEALDGLYNFIKTKGRVFGRE